MTEMTEAGIRPFLRTSWAGQRLVIYKEVGSTNTDAMRLGREGAEHGTLVIADKQTQGRGRNGRVWQTPEEKNIAMSLIVRPTIAPVYCPKLTLVMGLSLAEGVDIVRKRAGIYTPGKSDSEACGIKWPNDIVLNKHKLSGILTEMHMDPDSGDFFVVIGVGVNVNQEEFAPDIADMAGSLLTETGREFDRNEIIAESMNAFEENYALFIRSGNLESLKEKYEDRLLNKGQAVKVLDPAGEYQGRALGIKNGGELVVEREDGLKVLINAGEVSVRGLYGYV